MWPERAIARKPPATGGGETTGSSMLARSTVAGKERAPGPRACRGDPVDGLGGEEEGASVLGGHLRGSRRGTRSRGGARVSTLLKRVRKRHREKRGRSQSAGDRRAGSRDAAGATATDARSRASRGRRTLCDEAKCGVESGSCAGAGARGRATRAFHRDRRRCRRSNGGLSAPCWPQRGCADEGARNARFRLCRFGDRSRTSVRQSKKNTILENTD